MRRRVLVLTRDLVPLPGQPVSGGGIRAWGLGEALRGAGHDVVYSMPRAAIPEGAEHDHLRATGFELDTLQRDILRAEADVLLVEQWGLATYLEDTGLPTIIDLHGSLILENAFRRHRSLTSNAAAKIKALRKGDLFLCPGVRQRSYFMPWLMMSGADPLRLPIEVVPVSMPPELPERSASSAGPLTVVYGGQLWPWIDSGQALVSAARVLEETAAGQLHLFVGRPHQLDLLPHDDSSRVQTDGLPAELLASAAAVVVGKIARDELIERYRGAHLALDLYAHNTERELAFTTRTVEYMWCGLPVIYGDHGELAELIRSHEAGWIVPADAPQAIAETLREALGDRQELQRRSANARALVREHLSWDSTVAPLARFVEDPILRERGATMFGKLALEFDRIASEHEARSRDQGRELERLRVEIASRDERIGRLSGAERKLADCDSARAAAEHRCAELEQALQRALDAARHEQEAHVETCERYDRARGQAALAASRVVELERRAETLQLDLDAALGRIRAETLRGDERVEVLERQLRAAADAARVAEGDRATQVVRTDEARREQERLRREREQLVRELDALRGELRGFKERAPQRALETGGHLWRRVALQLPSVAHLFVRNIANNAYMTVWQKRHSIRIFPGQ